MVIVVVIDHVIVAALVNVNGPVDVFVDALP
jgi:hypothetical protein